jgi:plasmid stabilization system protein ParE
MLTVILTHAALDDLDDLLAFFARESPASAEHLLESVHEALASLGEFPLRFPIAEESPEWNREVRSMLVHRYRVLYEVRRSNVMVLRIVHGHRRRPVRRPR